ncbi:hypothetical protein GCM10008938_29010 [Deinococcus roseus]|uniref:Uncharacterized protein n=2 Tax=Deinococcus roseus TaxID=392414 RepID=A0ABQ2D599_9DEIO|nr:hypothetical protein GCM10008938_29010 [Deinococcus roseus]
MFGLGGVLMVAGLEKRIWDVVIVCSLLLLVFLIGVVPFGIWFLPHIEYPTPLFFVYGILPVVLVGLLGLLWLTRRGWLRILTIPPSAYGFLVGFVCFLFWPAVPVDCRQVERDPWGDFWFTYPSQDASWVHHPEEVPHREQLPEGTIYSADQYSLGCGDELPAESKLGDGLLPKQPFTLPHFHPRLLMQVEVLHDHQLSTHEALFELGTHQQLTRWQEIRTETLAE